MSKYFLLVILVLISEGTAEDFYVRPTNQTCPVPCHTLNQYAQNVSLFEGQTNISLLFLSGEHYLKQDLEIKDREVLTITALSGPESVTVYLNGSLMINNASLLSIRHISMSASGDIRLRINDAQNVNFYRAQITNVKISILSNTSSFNAEINSCTLTFTTITAHYGLMLEQGTLNIMNTNITGNNGIQVTHTCSLSQCNGSTINLIVQNANFKGQRNPIGFGISIQTTSTVNLELVDTNITDLGSGVDINASDETSVTVTGGRIANNRVGVNVLNSRVITLQINTSRIELNTNYGIRFSFQPRFSTINLIILNSVIAQNGEGVRITNAAVLNLELDNANITENLSGMLLYDTTNVTANITGVRIANNINGLGIQHIDVLSLTVIGCTIEANKNALIIFETSTLHVTMEDNVIAKNRYGFSTYTTRQSAVMVLSKTDLNNNAYGIVITEPTTNNIYQVLINNMRATANSVASIGLVYARNVIVKDSLFIRNNGTAISTFESEVILGGNTSFIDNVSDKGGAMTLTFSTVKFKNNSHILFQNNYANKVGGAIMILSLKEIALSTVSRLSISQEGQVASQFSKLPCFYQLDLESYDELTDQNITVTFVNNSAKFGGESIYGGTFYEYCSISDNLEATSSADIVQELVESTLHVTDTASGTSLSPVTSDPTRVCFCESGEPQCSNITYLGLNETRYPGETFNVSLVIVGNQFGTVTGSVFATLLLNNGSSALGSGQELQLVKFRECNDVEYTVFSSNKNESIILTADERDNNELPSASLVSSDFCTSGLPNIVCQSLLNTPIYINVTLESCPVGFAMSPITSACDCEQRLIENGIDNCVITNHTGLIQRSGTVWINESVNGNGVIVQLFCPNNYCRTEAVAVDLRTPDKQCVQNHVGTLCGGCRESYSTALGSNNCLECQDNINILLLIFFAAAGIFLVLFIKFLDLTVVNGTINGVIFYFNVLKALVALPTATDLGPVYHILAIPTAWINLDFGIETCFYRGMTGYMKTWLQFVFPLYIWSIAGLIILISHYSTRATKLFGSNSVAVLATLFLLSYSKLLRTIIIIVRFAELDLPDNQTHTVWAFDGNIDYFSPQHAGLFAIAILALLLLWLPYTTTILFVPWLRRKAQWKILSWVNTLKPFYDAYYGPFKDKHHYWPGLLLVTQAVILTVPAITSTSDPTGSLLALAIIPTCLLMYTAQTGQLYRKWYVSLLETSFHFNLAIFAGAVFYSQLTDRNIVIPVIISVSIALFQFLCIVIAHLCYKISKCLPKNLFKKRVKVTQSEVSISDLSSQSKIVGQQFFLTDNNVWSDNQLRESLLDYAED